MRVNVKLYGHLAGAVGPGPYALNVETLAEVFVALRTQMPEFAAHLKAHSSPGYCVVLAGKLQTYEDLQLLLPAGEDSPDEMLLKIVPGVTGSGDGKGIGLLIGGILLAIVSVGVGLAVTAGTFASYAALAGASIGLGMASQGVTQLLSPQPVTSAVAPREAERKRQYKFDSLSPTIMQGIPVPVRYGRQCVEGYPVSIKMVVEYDAG